MKEEMFSLSRWRHLRIALILSDEKPYFCIIVIKQIKSYFPLDFIYCYDELFPMLLNNAVEVFLLKKAKVEDRLDF